MIAFVNHWELIVLLLTFLLLFCALVAWWRHLSGARREMRELRDELRQHREKRDSR